MTRPSFAIAVLLTLAAALSPSAAAASECSVYGGKFRFERYFPKLDKTEVIGQLTLSTKVAYELKEAGKPAFRTYFITGYDHPNERTWAALPYGGYHSVTIYPDEVDQQAAGLPKTEGVSYTPKLLVADETLVLQGSKVFNEGKDDAFLHRLVPRGRLAACDRFDFTPPKN